MFQDTVPFSVQQAINYCLNAIGEPSVSTADPTLLGPDALLALNYIYQVSRDTQLVGWHWNKEVVTYQPDNNGYINLPLTIAKVDTTGKDYYIDVVQRGQKLYNVANNSFVFDSSLMLEVVNIMDFDDTPLSFKVFVRCQSRSSFPAIHSW